MRPGARDRVSITPRLWRGCPQDYRILEYETPPVGTELPLAGPSAAKDGGQIVGDDVGCSAVSTPCIDGSARHDVFSRVN